MAPMTSGPSPKNDVQRPETQSVAGAARNEVRGLPWPIFRPGLALAIPFLLGIWAADAVPQSTGALTVGLAGVAVLLATSTLLRRRRAAWVALLVAAALAGALRASLRQDLPADHVARFTPLDTGGDTALQGVVVSEPVFRSRPSPGPAPGGAPPSGTTSFDVEVECILEPAARPATGLVRVSAYVPLPALRPGFRVALHGPLRPPREPTNPGQIDHAARLRRAGIHRVLSVSRPDRIRILGAAEGHAWRRAVAAVRLRLLDALGSGLRPDVAAFLGAILLGAPDDLAPDLATAFRRTGTLHYIAISGFHLVMLSLGLGWAMARAGWGGRSARLAILAILACYTVLTGLKASAVRAFLMTAAVTGADWAGRRRDSLSSLAMAALAIAAVDPAQPFEAGFQLSFLAVFGILWIHPLLRAFVSAPRDPLRDLTPPGRVRRAIDRLDAYARDAVCVSMAAWLATAPLVASTFHLATPATNAANLLLCPFVLVELGGAAAKTATGLAGGSPDAALAAALQAVHDVMTLAARTLAAIPGGWIPVAGLTTRGVLLYAAALAAWVRRCRVQRPRRELAGIALIVVLLGLARTGPSGPAGLRVTTLDVGQGSAHVCETPEGGVLVFDCGSSGYADPGRSVVAPYLWSRGITEIDALVLSHPDADHVNGGPFLMESFRTRAVLVSPIFDRPVVGRAVLDRATREGIPILRASAGDVIAGVPGLAGDVLWPPPGKKALRHSGNEASMLVRVRGGGGSALFTGDIDARGVNALPAASVAGLAADAIIVPHHGSGGSRSERLVRFAGARFAIVSARRGFASEAALDEYRRAGAVRLATWEAGALWMEVEQGAWTVRTFAGSPKTGGLGVP